MKEAHKGLRKNKVEIEKKSKGNLGKYEWKVGMMYVKENTEDEARFIKEQNHRIRTEQQYDDLFKESGFQIEYKRNQEYKD